MVQSKSFSNRLATTLIVIVMILAVALALMPIINTVAISFSTGTAASSGKVAFWPVDFTLSAYQKILKDTAFWRAFGVSIARVVVGGFISIAATVFMAFPMSRNTHQFASRNIYMWTLVFCMLFNGGMIPTYMVIYKLGLINSFWSLVLPTAINVMNIILMMNFFKGIPASLEEAAIIDGASPYRILFSIVLPISLPSIATITLFTVVNYWNEFFNGLIYINDQTKIPLQTYLQQLALQQQNMMQLSKEEIMAMSQISSLSLNSAKILVSMIPVLIIYPLLQRFLVKGLVLGAVKE